MKKQQTLFRLVRLLMFTAALYSFGVAFCGAVTTFALRLMAGPTWQVWLGFGMTVVVFFLFMDMTMLAGFWAIRHLRGIKEYFIKGENVEKEHQAAGCTNPDHHHDG